MRILSVLIISILFILNIILGIRILNNTEKHKKVADALVNCKNKLEMEEYIVEYFEKSMEQQKETWNKSFTEVTHELNLGTKTYLCLRLSFHNCSKCIETELENLISVTKFIEPGNIILLINFQDNNQINYFIKEHQLPYKIIYCNYLDVGIENYKNPYYFILNNNEIQYPFIPLKEKPELFKSYIQNVLSVFN